MHQIKSFSPNDDEVTKFRHSIFNDDFNVCPSYAKIINFENHKNFDKLLFWYSDSKFLTNNFDQILLYYINGEAISMVGGTHFNKNLYRSTQMYYILKKYRKIPEMNTFHFRNEGFFDFQKARAKELECTGIFISVDPYDKRHTTMYQAMKKNLVGPGQMTNRIRKYTAEDFFFIDEKLFTINNTKQWIIYHNLLNGENDFEKLFNHN